MRWPSMDGICIASAPELYEFIMSNIDIIVLYSRSAANQGASKTIRTPKSQEPVMNQWRVAYFSSYVRLHRLRSRSGCIGRRSFLVAIANLFFGAQES
jgi:hypothetical protein